MSDASHNAHVEGHSGTFVVPAQSPYDRQILREYVERVVGPAAPLTLGMHGARWTITRRGAVDVHCSACTQRLGLLSCRRGDEARMTCIDCVMQPRSDEVSKENAYE